MPERETPGEEPEKVVDINELFKRRLERSGEKDAILAGAAAEMERYDQLKAEGKEVRGKWSVWVVEKPGSEEAVVRHLVGKDEQGKFVLLPNDAEHMHQDHIFPTDRQAEQALEELKRQFRDIAGTLEFRVMCGGIDDEQEPA